MCKELKDIKEIIDLAREEVQIKENKNITAVLDYQDLKSLLLLWDYYCEETRQNVDFNSEFFHKDKVREIFDIHYKQAKNLYENGVQPQAQYTMVTLKEIMKKLELRD